MIEYISLIVNSALSIALVYLYRENKNIQDRQTDIMAKQHEMRELSHKPEPILDRWVIFSDEDDSSSSIADYGMRITLSNIGEGRLTDIRYGIWVKFIEKSEFEQAEEKMRDGIDSLGYGAPLGRPGDRSSSSNYLEPNEKAVDFSAPQLVPSSNGGWVPFTQWAKSEETTDNLAIAFSVMYSDKMGEHQTVITDMSVRHYERGDEFSEVMKRTPKLWINPQEEMTGQPKVN
ncbi:hypothetical protein [Halolamina rubra]|uniref:hypothetical protein n=1 Tax=Halolamina rubra TaxID=1380430 RepID=UPI0012AB85A3|nr:hypothetical protein [Halolamina rubra]